jgi:hypothetical protein
VKIRRSPDREQESMSDDKPLPLILGSTLLFSVTYRFPSLFFFFCKTLSTNRSAPFISIAVRQLASVQERYRPTFGGPWLVRTTFNTFRMSYEVDSL